MDSEKIVSFPAESSEKVERLLDVLEEMVEHPLLKGRFAMYGGTAINLFMLDVPRFSVDIDATFIGTPDRDAMLEAKPEIERAIGEVAHTLGYAIDPGKDEHAGRSFFSLATEVLAVRIISRLISHILIACLCCLSRTAGLPCARI